MPKSATLLVLVAATLAPPANAEPSEGDDEDERGPDDATQKRVVVVADTPRATSIAQADLTGEALERVQGQGLSQALSVLPGVSTLSGTAGGMGKPIIRGQVGRRNLILFDGIRHEGQKWAIDHAPEIDPRSADRIVVHKGAATTRFGADAIGGAVSVLPRPLLRAPGHNVNLGMLGATNGLGGDAWARIDHAPRKLSGFAWRVHGNISRRAAGTTPQYPLDNTGHFNWTVGTRAGWQGRRLKLDASYGWLNQKAGICTCLRVSNADEFHRALERARPIHSEFYERGFDIERAYQRVEHHRATLRARFDLRSAGELGLVYNLQHNRRREFEIVRKAVRGPQVDLQLVTHAVEVQYEQPTSRLPRQWQLSGQAGAHASVQDNQFFSLTAIVPEYEQFRSSVFAIERLSHDRGSLEIGGRYTYVHRTTRIDRVAFLTHRGGGRIPDGLCLRTEDEGAECAHNLHAVSGALGATVKPIGAAPWLQLRLQLDSSARVPAIDEHFMNGSAPSFPMFAVGNPSLGIERTWGASTGVDITHTQWSMEASAFANRGKDYIYFRGRPQTGDCAPLHCDIQGEFPFFEFDAISARFIGGEVRLQVRPTSLPLELTAQAAWVRGVERATGLALSFQPADRYDVIARVLLPAMKSLRGGYIEVAPSFVYSGQAYDPESDFAPPPPGYITLGAGAGLDFDANGTQVRTGLLASNILDHKYRERSSLLRYFADEPGWNLQLRVAVTFGGDSGASG